uniref:Uncharacterized protein n=1 Tax=Kwoniella pini CBS 10737 TaxID=1296096 RepID=A0A1B9I0R9_9TREE|nr:uncharacterized protein I206_04804 [Kwoniella pini CBS 10737]OCF49117.1 hypothetical protein I206_04804 [Kwoniella pini CBS 10737]
MARHVQGSPTSEHNHITIHGQAYHQKQENQNPGSSHTRTGSVSSIRPSIRGHGRTPSTDHLMVPVRLDTLPQRKRKESLDTLRNQTIAHHPPVNRSQRFIPATPAVQNRVRDSVTPTPRTNEAYLVQPIPQLLDGHLSRNPIRSLSSPIKKNVSRGNQTPRPISKDLPLETTDERYERLRKLSSREILYPTPEAAQEAMRAERTSKSSSQHRRPPTPYTQSRRSSTTVKKINSDRSIRSRVSFDSTRSKRSNRSNRSNISAFDNSDSDDTLDDRQKWNPSFGTTAGIGPAGEAIEVIRLGRKKPRHRAIDPNRLKSALRSDSNLNSRVDLRNTSNTRGSEKPLPSRPMSYVAPIVNSISRVTAPTTRKMQKRASHQPTPWPYDQDNLGSTSSVPDPNLNSASLSRTISRNVHNARGSGDGRGIRSLFSSLSLGPSSATATSQQDVRSQSRSQGVRSSVGASDSNRRSLILPADDLYTYLRYVQIPSWDRWPLNSSSDKRRLSIWGGKQSLGLDEMSWEWHRRLNLAEDARMQGRLLGSWENQRGFERSILNCESHPIDVANRWGTQIFALPAEGFDTLDFFDDNISQAEDLGLLSWVTGTILQTAVSTLHMLRYSSSTFTFHLIPSPEPPHFTSTYEAPSFARTLSKAHFLWEGFGTMVLVNKSNDMDRAMIVEIRPPSVIDSSVMKEFARGKNGESWWGFYSETCVGDVGQANLLQAQVYDDCVQNQCFYFAVTNLKYWVFGQFSSDYTQCTVSPVLHRQAKNPSVMQCLTAWIVRSVDERPRAGDLPSQLPTSPQHTEREHRRNRRESHTRGPEVSLYTEGIRPRPSDSRSSFSLSPNPGYDHTSSSMHFQPSSSMGMMSPNVYPNTTQTVYPTNDPYSNYGLPSYNEIPHPVPTMSPSPYSQPGMFFPQQQWNNTRAFSPTPNIPHAGTPIPYNLGNSWYNGGGVGGMFPWGGLR